MFEISPVLLFLQQHDAEVHVITSAAETIPIAFSVFCLTLNIGTNEWFFIVSAYVFLFFFNW